MDSLFGITFTNWYNLLKKNNFDISAKRYFHMFIITLLSFRNSFYSRRDEILKNGKDRKIKDPIFILGHWRSGTTFLHNLLIQDRQFNFPRIFEVTQPFSFLALRKKYMKILEDREVDNRPMDSVKNGPLSPGEEEFAMAAITLKSPIIGWSFPKNFDYYERFLTLENIDENDRNLWKKEYLNYLNKVSRNSNKTLLLKSPVNTARIKFLLELFPNAKFINITRNPIDVFRSTKKLYQTAIERANLQGKQDYSITERIISTYKKVYESYFNFVNDIPKQNLINVKFEDLETSKIEILEKIYNELNLSNFEEAKPRFNEYIKSLKGYKKNKYNDIDNEILQKIKDNWKIYYERWGYKI